MYGVIGVMGVDVTIDLNTMNKIKYVMKKGSSMFMVMKLLRFFRFLRYISVMVVIFIVVNGF